MYIYIAPSSTRKKVLACPPQQKKEQKKRSLSFSLSFSVSNETLNINPKLFVFCVVLSTLFFSPYKKKTI